MKIWCIERNSFLITVQQRTILINCPLEIIALYPLDLDPYNEHPSSSGNQAAPDILSLLKLYDPSRKQASTSDLSRPAEQTLMDKPVFRTLPFEAIDIKTIDVVLVTHYEAMLGLPYLTEYLGYKGPIYVTEPTITFAHQRMIEMIEYYTKATASPDAKYGPVPIDCYKSLYTSDNVRECINRLLPVRFDQAVTVFSSLRVTAKSSGYTLGSANWLLESGLKRIAIFSSSCSNAVFHPTPLDLSVLESANVVLICGTGTSNREAFDLSLKRCVAHVCNRLAARENAILVTAITSGLVYDLLWMLSDHLAQLGIQIGTEAHQAPIYMISPVAKQSLDYALVTSEWMSRVNQEHAMQSNPPLPHGRMLANKALTTFASILDIFNAKQDIPTSPSLIFTGDHKVLGVGPLAWYLQYWRKRSDCVYYFLDPELSAESFETHKARSKVPSLHIPLDSRLNVDEALDIVLRKNMQSQYILAPGDSRSTMQLDGGCQLIRYIPGSRHDIDLNITHARIVMKDQVARSINLQPSPYPGVTGMARFVGEALMFNNDLVIDKGKSIDANPATSMQTVLGIMDKLHKAGITKLSYENKPTHTHIHGAIDHVSFDIEVSTGHILVSAGSDEVQHIVRRLFMLP
ncbi:hypothetical protein DM01DRAFT_1055419 [Hesseltinella vesiculosa]|uniref:Metallo-beta-lactamase domain-containing protein n=1 Tax=Hesseltinella vesiculosa TaxID=101127 RepID=A0A1X2GFR1_9FUNG|nr:hypothetical protein DM01DRAFT_1055419 [Hesseltinella vesiculosa]